MAYIIASIALVCLGLLALFFTWQNNDIIYTHVTHKTKKLPQGFDGFRIVHLSDIHNTLFGKEQERLIDMVDKASPEAIFITGDLIDKRRPGVQAAADLLRGLMKIAPVYYVSGNHEYTSKEYGMLKGILITAGATMLEEDKTVLTRGEDEVLLFGMKDYAFYGTGKGKAATRARYYRALKSLQKENDKQRFTILLSHRPELFTLYQRAGIEITFCGHAHGGQARLPLIGGLFAPGQGLFPRYTAGLYERRGSALVVSRGLGNSSFPLRCFNRPDVVVMTFLKDTNYV